MENLDTTFDLMVERVLEYDEIAFLELVQFIWRRGWKLEGATAPSSTDLLKNALKACFVERMVQIWSAPPKNSPEKAPEWCKDIPMVEDGFSVIKPEEQPFWQGEPANEIFKKRNIFAPKEFMFFL
ncbi:MAG: hypothetical protein WCY88_13925 [Spongiibacteraceae bacterium]